MMKSVTCSFCWRL